MLLNIVTARRREADVERMANTSIKAFADYELASLTVKESVTEIVRWLHHAGRRGAAI